MDPLLPNKVLFEENLKKFSLQNPEMEMVLRELEPKRLTLCQTGNKELNIKQTVPGRAFFYSSKSAQLEMKMWFQSLHLKDVEVLFVYGLGLGSYFAPLRAWLDQNKKHYVVFFEDDREVLKLFLSTSQASLLLSHPQVMIKAFETVIEGNNDPRAHSWGKFRADFDEIFGMFQDKPCRFSALLFYAQEKPEASKRLLQEIQFNLETKAYEIVEFSAPFHFAVAKNSYRNLYLMQEFTYTNAMQGAFSKVPALICGAGPSIHKHLTLIETLADKALVFAAGSGMNVLTRVNIQPHLSGGIDPSKTQVSRSLTQFGFEVPCCFSFPFSFEAVENMQTTWLYTSLGTNVAFMKWFEEQFGLLSDSSIETGNSTSHFCFLVAKLLGCNPIFLVGMDLAYTTNRRYASQVVSHPTDDQGIQDQIDQVAKQAINAKNVFGEHVKTNFHWLTEAGFYERFLTDGLKVFNASEGIPIPGIAHLSLEEAAEHHFSKQVDLINWIHAQAQWHLFHLSKQKIKEVLEKWLFGLKKVKHLLATKETSFMEEDAYRYLLKPFDLVWKQNVSLQRWQWKTHPTTYTKTEVEKRESALSVERFSYLEKLVDFHVRIANEVYEEMEVEEDFESVPVAQSSTSLKKECSYKENLLHGPSRFYTQEGQLLADSHFIEGKREGETRQYYLDGNLFSDLLFKEGKLEGRQLYYYKTGALKTELTYHLGKLHGQVRLYWPNSHLKRQIHFTEGVPKGIERRLDDEGNLLFEVEHT